jgi:hypothetical protein
LIASAGGSDYAFDADGNGIGQLAMIPSYSWNKDAYASTSSGIAMVEALNIPWGTTYGAMPYGNPSTPGTSVGVSEIGQGPPTVTLRSRGGDCSLALTPDVANKPDPLGIYMTRYAETRSALLATGFLDPPTSSEHKCSDFFHENTTRGGWFSKLRKGVENQNVFDGVHTNLSKYDAGMLSQSVSDNYPTQVEIFKSAPVCGDFAADRFFLEGIIVVASSQIRNVKEPDKPATDVFLSTRPEAMGRLTQADILHEAMHNLTGLHDFLRMDYRKGAPSVADLKTLLGIEKVAGRDPHPRSTEDISDELKKNRCAQ